jgi:hypothetical protein
MVAPVSPAGTREVEPCAGPVTQFPRTGYKVGVNVRLRHVSDPETIAFGGVEIGIDSPVGIDHQCLSGARAADEIAGLCQLGVEEAFKDHVADELHLVALTP